MPFLYTVAPANNYATSNALFADKGISDSAPARPCDLLLIGRPHQYEIAYGSYIHNLSAFLRATALQSKVSAVDPGQSFSIPLLSYLPITPPPLLLKPSIPLHDDGARNQMISTLATAAEIVNFQEQAHVAIERPTFLSLQPHFGLFDTDNRTTTNTSNLVGYRSFLTTVKILTAFLATHHYAAFQSPESNRLVNTAYLRCPSAVQDVDTTSTPDYMAELIARGLPPITTAASRRNLVGTIPEAADGVWNLQSSVVVAQPSPLRPEINFGPAG
jgi:hypothetical protein